MGVIATRVDRSFLETLAPELLLRLVMPFAAELSSLGMPCDANAVNTAWRDRLHQALNRDGILASTLQIPLAQIQALATEEGHRLIALEASSRGLGLGGPKLMPAADLALSLYLGHPALFRSIRAQVGIHRFRTFAEYHGIGPPTAELDAVLPDLEVALASRFRDLWLGDFCEVVSSESVGEILLEVRRAGNARSMSVIGTEGRPAAVHIVPEERDVVVYNGPAQRLSVCAPHPEIRDVYRTELGRLLGGSRDHFQSWKVFSAEPLVRKGSGAFDASDLAEIKRVVLQGMEYTTSTRKRGSIGGDDVGPELDALRQGGILEAERVSSWTLGLVVPGHSDVLQVRIWPPNEIAWDDRLRADAVRQFLRARRFLVPPPSAWGPDGVI